MSDALTDIMRDKQKAQLMEKIAHKEFLFYKSPSNDLAKELFALWKQYASVPRGYWTSLDITLAYAKVASYQEYLNSGEYPFDVFPQPTAYWEYKIKNIPLRDFKNKTESLEIYIQRAIDGHGNWLEDLQLILTKAAEIILGRSDTIKLVITKDGIQLQPVDCSECPYFHNCSLAHVFLRTEDGKRKKIVKPICKGFNEKILSERENKFNLLKEKGKKIIKGGHND